MGSHPYGLRPHLIGGGTVAALDPGSFRLELPVLGRGYGDAQLDDSRGLPRRRFHWSPPVDLSLRARASHNGLPGTLGFGFWNDPLGVSVLGAQRLPAAPQAAWFFHAGPPNDFSFVASGPGAGWKAAVLRSPRIPAVLLVPAAALAFAGGRLPPVRPWVVRAIQASVVAAERELSAPLDEWHGYRLRWEPTGVRFEVDGRLVLETPVAPRGPLGFVVWIDNQYAVLSTRLGIRFGVSPTVEPAWLEVQNLEIHSPAVPRA